MRCLETRKDKSMKLSLNQDYPLPSVSWRFCKRRNPLMLYNFWHFSQYNLDILIIANYYYLAINSKSIVEFECLFTDSMSAHNIKCKSEVKSHYSSIVTLAKIVSLITCCVCKVDVNQNWYNTGKTNLVIANKIWNASFLTQQYHF